MTQRRSFDSGYLKQEFDKLDAAKDTPYFIVDLTLNPRRLIG
jgi:hypothetical protein